MVLLLRRLNRPVKMSASDEVPLLPRPPAAAAVMAGATADVERAEGVMVMLPCSLDMLWERVWEGRLLEAWAMIARD